MSSPCSSQFTYFSCLPIEIRLKIWQYIALDHPPRVLELSLDMYESQFESAHKEAKRESAAKASIPPSLRVNREARDETLRYYTRAKVGRMDVRFDDPFRLYRPEKDILFVSEAAPSRMRRMRPLEAATFPLECLAHEIEDVRRIQYVAVVLITQDLLAVNIHRTIRLLREFRSLRELFLVVPTYRQMFTCQELRRWGFDIPRAERVFIDPWKVSPDRIESLEVNSARIREFERKLLEHSCEDWTPPKISFRHAIKGT